MAKQISIGGNITATPPAGMPGSTRQFPLTLAYTAPQSLCETFDVSGTLLAPYVLPTPLPAKLVAVRVLTSGPVTLLLTGPGGTDQAIQVSDMFMAVAQAAPFTAVKVAGTASISVLVAT